MRILVTGLCSLHMGRLEYGNMGNYYIIEPLFRELHRVFKNADIVTTFQMTESFCLKEDIKVLPLDLYYTWSEYDLSNAFKEFAIAEIFSQTGEMIESTAYIEEVLKSDLVIDFSGDMWGDNADLAGENRFLINLLKNRVVQLFNKPIAMIAGSPGPFDNQINKAFAQLVYKNFDFITNREPLATKLLLESGFDLSRTKDSMCPAFGFKPVQRERILEIFESEGLCSEREIVGFTICGFNMPVGPYQRWPREDYEYKVFVEVIEEMVSSMDVDVVLLSHTNGFNLVDDEYEIIQGRDYPILCQLYDILENRNVIDMNKVKLIHSIYTPAETKGIISQFDMFVSGRAHGAVAAYSQNVPCVILNYSNGPVAHKLQGFALTAGMESFIADSNSKEDIMDKVEQCFDQKGKIRESLSVRNKEIIENIQASFDDLLGLIQS